MLNFAITVTAICLAIPLTTLARMLATGPRTRARIRRAFHDHASNAQGATSSAKTPVAPRNPARYYAHEVHSS